MQASAVYVNDTDAADARSIPAHSICVVTQGGLTSALAKVIFDKKAPGIGTFGSVTGTATDAEGNPHTVRFSRFSDKMTEVYLFISVLPGGEQAKVRDAVRPAVWDFIDRLGIGEPLNVPQLYGIAYAADPSIANTFVITDIQVTAPGASSVIRDVVPCAWNEKITCDLEQGVDIRFS